MRDESKKPHEWKRGWREGPLLLAAAGIGTFLSHFTAGVMNVALPQLAVAIGQPLSHTQWLLTGYLLVVMLLLPLMGRLGDRIGKDRVHHAGFACFLVGSISCLAAPNWAFLLAGRIIQAGGAAMLQAVNIGIVAEAYSGKGRGKALGCMGSAVATGAMLGPPVGGLLLEWFPWRSLFALQLPLAVGGLWLSCKYIPRFNWHEAAPFDGVGMLWFFLTAGGLTFALQGGTSPIVSSVSLLGGVLGLVLLVHHSKKKEHAIFEGALFRVLPIRFGLFIGFSSFSAVFAVMVLLPFFLKDVYSLPPTATGLIMMCYPLLLAIFGPISGSLGDKAGSFYVIEIGILIMLAAVFLLFFLGEGTHLFYICLALAFLGAGMAFVSSPNYSMVMASVPTQFSGQAGSLLALSRNAGMLAGSALAFVCLAVGQGNSIFGYRALFFLAGSLLCYTFLSVKRTKNKLFARQTDKGDELDSAAKAKYRSRG